MSDSDDTEIRNGIGGPDPGLGGEPPSGAGAKDGRNETDAGDDDHGTEPLVITLKGEARQAIDLLSERYGGVGTGEALRRALGLATFLVEESRRGSVVIIESQTGERHRLMLPE